MNRHNQRLAHTRSGHLNKRQMNGLGASFFDVVQDALVQTGEQIVESGQRISEEQGSKLIDQAMNTPEFKKILTKVEKAGEQGVKKAAGENAMYLAGIAVAGGAVGGILSKSTVGAVGVAALAAWAAVNLLGQGE